MSFASLRKRLAYLSRQLIDSSKLVSPRHGRVLACQTGFASALIHGVNSPELVRPFGTTGYTGLRKKGKAQSPPLDNADIDVGGIVEDNLPINFDYAKVKKLLFHEDGTPDVLYRRLEVKCLAHESPVLDSYQSFVEMTTDRLRIPVQVEEPCRVVERKTVLRSAFVHKDIRVQYEWYTFYRLFKFSHLTGSTADTLLEYLQRSMPEGMAMEVTKTRVERLPVGVEAAKGETPTKDEILGGRMTYDVDSVKPFPKPDPAKMPDDWDPHSKDERFDPIPV